MASLLLLNNVIACKARHRKGILLFEQLLGNSGPKRSGIYSFFSETAARAQNTTLSDALGTGTSFAINIDSAKKLLGYGPIKSDLQNFRLIFYKKLEFGFTGGSDLGIDFGN